MGLKNSKIMTAALVAVALTAVSLSVSGILQSTESLGSSGIIIESAPASMPQQLSSPSPPPPEPEVEIDVYEDLECTTFQSSIEWGEIEAGSSSSVIIYIKNNGDTDVLLGLDSENWTPTNALDHTTLLWNDNGSPLTPGEVRRVKLTLNVNSKCPPMDTFGFDVVIIGI